MQFAFDSFDHRMMARAIALARRGEGRVEPNPMVGCVIVRKHRVIGEGFHRRFGGPHAEVEALRNCAASARGATVYVTLEPCCHHGKTPPCTDALIKAGVGKVMAATGDPGPHVAGKGFRFLRAAGITVQTGLMEREALQTMAPYLTRLRTGRPYVIAKWAQSLDGKLATRTGESRWISGEASRRRVHELRARVDAIVVGSGTVLADDPLLTAREVHIRRRAVRVVLDGRLRIPNACRLAVTAAVVPTLVFTRAKQAKSRKAASLRLRHVEVVACGTRGGRLALDECLSELARRGATNVLLEGGPLLLSAFLEAALVDEALVFCAPMLIGGDRAPSALSGRGAEHLDAALRPETVTVRRVGPDTLYRMYLTVPPSACNADSWDRR